MYHVHALISNFSARPWPHTPNNNLQQIALFSHTSMYLQMQTVCTLYLVSFTCTCLSRACARGKAISYVIIVVVVHTTITQSQDLGILVMLLRCRSGKKVESMLWCVWQGLQILIFDCHAYQPHLLTCMLADAIIMLFWEPMLKINVTRRFLPTVHIIKLKQA